MVRIVGESRYDSGIRRLCRAGARSWSAGMRREAAVEMAVDHPMLGIGLDQFQTQYVGHYKPPEAKLNLDSAHSMWAELAAELGFPVLVLVLLVYAAALLALARLPRAAGRLHAAPGRSAARLAGGLADRGDRLRRGHVPIVAQHGLGLRDDDGPGPRAPSRSTSWPGASRARTRRPTDRLGPPRSPHPKLRPPSRTA